MVKFVERVPGVYRCRFKDLDTAFELTDKETGDQVIRWRWVFQEVADSTTMGELDTITSPSLKPRTNGLKFFTGMLGRPPNDKDDTDDLIGNVYDVTYGPNQNGRYTITAVTILADEKKLPKLKAVTEPPVQEPVANGDDELPF